MNRSNLLSAALLAVAAPALALPAFPGAEGWGAETPAGRGPDPKAKPPKVFVVTTLASSGKGSLNEALQATGPRIITFAVSGVIDLNPTGAGNSWLPAAANSNVTIAGQTSPGGITLKSTAGGSSVLFSYEGGFRDAVFRFLRFRAGAHNEDAFTFSEVNNFVIDHCDFSGGSDETLDLSSCHTFTVQWSTIANSSAGQTYGFLMANYEAGYHMSVHHNLIANHVNRFPEMHWNGTPITDNVRMEYSNNVCYNGRDYFFIAQQWDTPDKAVHINFIGNTFKAGPDSPPNAEAAEWFFSMNHLDDHFLAYEKDNVMITKAGQVDRNRVNQRFAYKTATPVAAPAVKTTTADSAYEKVLGKAGAWPRDPMALRTVNEVRTKTGQLRKDNDALITTGPAAPADADQDGMADAWENLMGLNPASAADNVLDQDNDGYLNVEEYINDVALARLGEPLLNPKAASAIVSGVGVARRGNVHGDNRLLARRDAGRSTVRIHLPRGARAEGRIEISDTRGRVLASLPAREVTEWNPGADGVPQGLYGLAWISGGRVLLSDVLAVE